MGIISGMSPRRRAELAGRIMGEALGDQINAKSAEIASEQVKLLSKDLRAAGVGFDRPTATRVVEILAEHLRVSAAKGALDVLDRL